MRVSQVNKERQEAAEPSSEFANDRTSRQRSYDAMVAARMNRRSSSSFSTVSMYGELPELSATAEPNQPGNTIQQHTFATDGECFDPRVSPDGKWMAFASTQHTLKPEIYIKPIHSTAITQITNSPASDVQPAFSLDSRRIAFCSDRSGNWDLYMVDTDGRNLQQLTDDPAAEMHPSFSRDSSKITYCRYNSQSGQWEVWLLDVGNPGQRKFLASGLFPSFSPKEEKIVYQRSCQRGSQLFAIWSIMLTEEDQPSAPTQIASSSDRALINPQWSPDGKMIVYCAVVPRQGQDTTADQAQVWVVDANGTGRLPVTEQGLATFSPTWGSDNRIYFCANRGGSENIWSVPPVGGLSGASGTARAIKSQPAGESRAKAVAVGESTSAEPASEPVLPNHPVHLKTDGHGTANAEE